MVRLKKSVKTTKSKKSKKDIVDDDEPSTDINVSLMDPYHPAVMHLREYAEKNMKYCEIKFSHFAMIYSNFGKSGIRVHSYGMNQLREGRTIHAEVDAINKLKPRFAKSKGGGRQISVKILVIRLSMGKCKYSESKCCAACSEAIYQIPPLRGYNIEEVAFSRSSGEIEVYHPVHLLLTEPHLSFYYVRRGWKPKVKKRIKEHPRAHEKLIVMRCMML